MELLAVEDADDLAISAADHVAQLVAECPDALILAATGDTPMGCYAELARRRADGVLDTGRLRVAQLDEYLGVGADDRRSLFGWTRRALCDPLGIEPERIVRLRGDAADPAEACLAYEAGVAAAGGVDLAVLGLGPNGHLGFNEPPTRADAPTRVVSLTPESLESNARYWGDGAVPEHALTAGMSIILAARHVLLLVSGAHKTAILRRLLHSSADPMLPASWLHRHPTTLLLADRAALGPPGR